MNCISSVMYNMIYDTRLGLWLQIIAVLAADGLHRRVHTDKVVKQSTVYQRPLAEIALKQTSMYVCLLLPWL